MKDRDCRRVFLAAAGASALLTACGKERASAEPSKEEEGPAVSATEDLMREHGVIRRVLVVYREAATRLHSQPTALTTDALERAARLIRTCGEDYHEKQLEEAHVFPSLLKKGDRLAEIVNTLTAQHQRGRTITEYVLAVTQKPIGAQTAEPLARALEAFARMYEEHAAIEDTVVFPAWKNALATKALVAAGERFEEIEHKYFGKDGFQAAVDQIEAIERTFGLELGRMTAPLPPAR